MTNQEPTSQQFGTQPLNSAHEPEYTGVASNDLDNTPAYNDIEETDAANQKQAQVEKSIAGSTWVALIIGAILLILLLVFIMQNQENVQLQLFAWEMNFPIGAGMLIAAITGALIMALVGGVRILQLRRQVVKTKR